MTNDPTQPPEAAAPNFRLAVARGMQSIAAVWGDEAVTQFFADAAGETADSLMMALPLIPQLKRYAKQQARDIETERIKQLLNLR